MANVTLAGLEGAARQPTITRVVPLRRPGQWLLALVVAVMALVVSVAFIRSPHIDWSAVGRYLFHKDILIGVRNTLILTALAVGFGNIIGLLVALMGLSTNRVFRALADGFVYVFRGIPVLVQLILWFNLALIFPNISIGIPFTDLVLLRWSTNDIMTPFISAVIGLSLAEAGYSSEVFRSGFISIPKGQTEAARSLGMRESTIIRRILVPQAMRVVLPPLGNQVIQMLKMTAIVAFIAGSELFTQAQKIYSRTYEVIELLLVATFWYLVMVSILSFIQSRIERRLNQGYAELGTRQKKPSMQGGSLGPAA